MKKFACLLAAAAAGSIIMVGTALAAALPASTQYTITVSKVNNNGTLTAVDTTTATTDAEGKLDFTLTTIPTKDDCNFVYFQLTDASSNVVREGFAPAPPEADTNKLGINDLSTIQAKTLKAVAALLGASDDADNPIPVAYLLIMLRSNDVSDADIPLIGQMGKTCITGTGGFEDFLTTEAGVTEAKLTALKSCLIYNPDPNKKTLRNFSENFYDSVNAADAASEQEKMQQAGGFMAEIFMDAAVCAGIEPELILAAHNAAGEAPGSEIPMGQLATQNANFMNSINQAMTSFHMRIAAAKVATEYTNALETLDASGDQVDNFLAAGETMFTAFSDIEALYGDYFMDPAAYRTATGKTDNEIQDEIDQAYSTVFENFQTDIASTNQEITALKTSVATLLGVNANQLPEDFGQSMNFSGSMTNWPIPQTVMVQWLADFLTAGGSFTYTRATTPLPDFAEAWWAGTCTTAAMDQMSCGNSGGIWNSSSSTCSFTMNKAFCEGSVPGGSWQVRHDFTGMTPVAGYNNLMALREDIQIEEMARYSLYQGEEQPTRAEEKAAKLAFASAIDALVAKMGGTLADAQKKAIVLLLKQPSME